MIEQKEEETDKENIINDTKPLWTQTPSELKDEDYTSFYMQLRWCRREALFTNPKLDFERLDQINQALNIPLVIHGGTGLSDDQFKRLISAGVSKINYYTALADAAGRQIRANTSKHDHTGYTGIVKGAKEKISRSKK